MNKMKYLHYTEKTVEWDMDKDYSLHPFPHLKHEKPYGLWFSVEDPEIDETWKNFCTNTKFNLERLEVIYEIHFKETANILQITNEEEFDDFQNQYGFNKEEYTRDLIFPIFDGIAWDLVKKDYDAIIIAPYLYSRRLHHFYGNWYYGWDCSSGCVWNLKSIQKIERI